MPELDWFAVARNDASLRPIFGPDPLSSNDASLRPILGVGMFGLVVTVAVYNSPIKTKPTVSEMITPPAIAT